MILVLLTRGENGGLPDIMNGTASGWCRRTSCGRARPDSAWGDCAGLVGAVRNTILEFERKHPGASHKLVNGHRDVIHGSPPDLTHKACREAAEGLAGLDFRFYWVYGYTYPQDPERGRYALGYHSAGKLMIDPAAADPHEHIDLPRSARQAEQ